MPRKRAWVHGRSSAVCETVTTMTDTVIMPQDPAWKFEDSGPRAANLRNPAYGMTTMVGWDLHTQGRRSFPRYRWMRLPSVRPFPENRVDVSHPHDTPGRMKEADIVDRFGSDVVVIVPGLVSAPCAEEMCMFACRTQVQISF